VPELFAHEVLASDTFSDYALTIQSGISPFVPDENQEASTMLNNFLEQIRYEKGGTAGPCAPVRVWVEGDQKVNTELYDECLVEDAVDKNTEFPY
jgi:hypothetical protein